MMGNTLVTALKVREHTRGGNLSRSRYVLMLSMSMYDGDISISIWDRFLLEVQQPHIHGITRIEVLTEADCNFVGAAERATVD